MILLSTFSVAQQKNPDHARPTFQFPILPVGLTDPGERATYLFLHYWENFRFADTSLLFLPETEQAFVDFLQVLPYVSPIVAEEGMKNLLDRAMITDSIVFAHFIGWFEKYLYEQDSPMYNEEYYIPVLQYIKTSPKISALDKVRPQYQLTQALKNRPKNIATNFIYTLPDGNEKRLTELASSFTLVFFNDPDCDRCREIKKQLSRSTLLSDTLKAKLTVLAIYPNEEIEVWRREKYPRGWINSYDARQAIRRDNLYDLSVMPSLYLLDWQKRVLLKNSSVEAIEMFFRSELSH